MITDDDLDTFMDDACVLGGAAARELAKAVWRHCGGDDDELTESGETMHLLLARSTGFLLSVVLADCPPDLRSRWLDAIAVSTPGLRITAAGAVA